MRDAMIRIGRARTDAEIRRCHAVMTDLRPHVDEDSFLSRVRAQEAQGYSLIHVRRMDECLAVAGFRILESLSHGRFVYVDDLVTSPGARSAGYGAMLIAWLETHGRENGCGELHLDSGTQRRAAHRFYLRERFDITGFHFAKKL